MTLDTLNTLPEQEADAWFGQCCAATKWRKQMTQQRPFTSLESIKKAAVSIWNTLEETDFLEAFEAHPMIGDVASLKAKFAHTQAMASHEQKGASEADDSVLQRLSELNHAYLNKNGFIFIICATGLSAQIMLEALEERIHHSREEELRIAAQQQIQITLLRLEKNL
ncbi:2-oxo-4-hydroxy-4-carboxy-5-ureidoimidazoline decarboxylase [Alteromonas sp. a30]|uniref:2-oxo-4-hydroxy-4-carboxy-5-ureidoimidazoline decarboxylase n=1 Tax=Alteromonas sp. a30 TaxID=2730917 RepID=UPI00227F5D85|nr:2-oxo-4-hydroxy-4-carboxy-5-ureidoimidazoline decarboxylase [Alteromonas sp. a30]MCY7293888.1 2-oxo-4-hydroxy-4-carboxy-5-ureidoimidazoline decarboxylase [Alteromonas sp. a30]